MKICLINHLFEPYARGGAEKVVAFMIKNYQEAGHEVFLITTKHRGARLRPTEASASHKNKIYYINSEFYNLHKKPISLRLIWHLKNLFDFKKFNACQKILNEEKPDLVITHNLIGLGFMLAQAIKLSGAKHHHFLHDLQLLHPSGLMFFGKENIINTPLARLYQKITRHLIGEPDLVISPSKWLLREHQNKKFFLGSKTEITSLKEILSLNNGDGFAGENSDRPDNQANHKILLFAGQLEEHKGINFLIEAFKKLALPNLRLKIAGSGNAETRVLKLIDDDNRIQFLGHLKKESLEEELKKADFLIVPSLCYENSPAIIIEAKNFGLKIIASNLGGIPEIIEPTDILFNPGDEQDLFNKINQL